MASIRAAVARGRIDGTMESIVMVLTDACLADCIEQLGDHSDHPTSDQLRAVLPGLVERHGLGPTRMMLASTVAGEASAAAVIRDLLKHDELVKLPAGGARPVEAPDAAPTVRRRRARRRSAPSGRSRSSASRPRPALAGSRRPGHAAARDSTAAARRRNWAPIVPIPDLGTDRATCQRDPCPDHEG